MEMVSNGTSKGCVLTYVAFPVLFILIKTDLKSYKATVLKEKIMFLLEISILKSVLYLCRLQNGFLQNIKEKVSE